MIKTIFNFTKASIFSTRIYYQNTTNINSTLFSRSAFKFSVEEPTPIQEQSPKSQSGDEDRAAGFYRNSIRRININDKGKGKFTEHHLIRLIKLTRRVEQQPLLFQAYYNYLGHFTVISNNTVDKMLLKSLSFEGSSVQKIIQIFENHNYLGYFPHFSVTSKLVVLCKSNQQHYNKLLNIFISSPLIKFNSQIFNIIAEDLKNISVSNTIFSLIIKLFTQRAHFKLLDQFITRRQLLKKIVEGIEIRLDNKLFKNLRQSQTVRKWCLQVIANQPLEDSLHYQIAILGINNKMHIVFAKNLIQIKDQEKVIRCLLYLEQCSQSFQKATVKYLNKLEISTDLKVRLEEFNVGNSESSGEGEPASVETE